MTLKPARAHAAEIAGLLGLSLGASAVYAILAIIDRATRNVPIGAQTTSMNNAVTPDRPWLDLAYQLAAIGLGLIAPLFAIFLLRHRDPPADPRIGADRIRPGQDLLRGIGLAAVIGIPGLGLYAAGRALGITTTIQAANLTEQWWTVPVLVLAAAQNGILEEVVVVGYLITRLEQIGLRARWIVAISAVLRGSYHLYQGFGPFVGNAVMGIVFAVFYLRTRRVMPLIVAHTLLDIVAFVGYTFARGHFGL